MSEKEAHSRGGDLRGAEWKAYSKVWMGEKCNHGHRNDKVRAMTEHRHLAPKSEGSLSVKIRKKVLYALSVHLSFLLIEF